MLLEDNINLTEEDNDIIPVKKTTQKLINTISYSKKNNILSVLSYTLSYNCSYFLEKINKIINLIKINKPDIISLHLIEEKTFNEINSKINSIYENIQIFKNEKDLQFSSVLFLKRDTIIIENKSNDSYYFDYENSPNLNKIIGVSATINNKKLHIITTHLEDKDENDTLRAEQFDILLNSIKTENIKKAIILGNFESNTVYEPLDDKILQYPILKDSWIVLGCPNNVRNTYYDYRHDRIFTYNIKKMVPISCSLFGTQYVSDIIKQTPSDNFGLIVKFLL